MTDPVNTPSPGPLDDPTHMTTLGTDYDHPTMTTNPTSVDGHGLKKDQLKTTGKEGSSLVTLSPYTPPRTHKKQKRNMHTTLNFDDMFGPQRWTKYFEIKSPLEDDFELYSRLAKEVGSDILFRRQPDGITIIEASNADQSEKLEMLMESEDPNLPVQKNKSLNACFGTIIVPNDISIGSKTFAECGEKIKQNIMW